MSRHIREGDRVIAIAGNDKGHVGKVLWTKGERVLVEGLNKRKKHVKRTSQAQTATIIDREMPVHISNVQIATEDGRPVRLKVRMNKSGERELYYMNEGKAVFYRNVKKPA